MQVADLIKALKALPLELPVVAYADGMFSPKPHVIVMELPIDNTDWTKERPTVFIDGWGAKTMTCADLVEALVGMDAGLPVRIKDDVAYYEPDPELVPAGGDYRGAPFEQATIVI